MTCKSVYTLPEIRFLWKSRGNKNYEMKCLNTSGNFIQSITFKDIRNHREVSGKLVASAREGDAYHWPRLMHENLAPLLDVVSINENISIYITTASKRSLRVVICEDGFQRDAACLNRKKSYAEDVLWGLDYLHGKNLCLMNLSEDNIYINERDRAVIADFSHLVLAKRATKKCVSVYALYRAPELDAILPLEDFDAIKAEIWACGVMLLQMFTGYAIPTTYAVVDKNLSEFVSKMDRDFLIRANIGASVPPIALSDFQNFINLFLCMDPSSRAPVKTAAINTFLKRNTIEHVKQSELNCPKTEDISHPPPFIDSTANCVDVCIVKHEEKIIPPDYMKAVTPLSAAILNREKLKQYSPYNKFINLKYISRQEDCIFDSLSSNQSNWNMQPMEKERITQEINRNQTQIQAIKRNTEEITVQKGKSLPNTYATSEETNNFPLITYANAENVHLKSFTNISTELHKTNEKLKKVENSSLVKENNFSELCDGISNDTIDSNEFHTMASTKNSNENINNSCRKIANATKNKNTNSVYACTRKLRPGDFERSYTIDTNIDNSPFNHNSKKSPSIFPNSSFPCLNPSQVRGSLHWNTTIHRSASFDDSQLMKPRGIPNLLNTYNIDQVQNESLSKWRYFFFHHDETTVGESDRKSSPWKITSEENISDLFINIYSDSKTRETHSPNSMKVPHFDIQEAEETRTNFVYQDKPQFGTTLSHKNSKYFKEYFKQTNYSTGTHSKSSVNNEPNGMSSCSNGTMERNNSARNSHENITIEDIDSLKNFNSNFEFVLEESNCMGVMKEQVGNCSFRCDIPEGSNVRENDTNNIPSVTKDFYEQKSIEREQQFNFLNPTFDTVKWDFEIRQDKDELNDTNSSEIQQEDYITAKHLDLRDHIGAFERNLDAFSEVSLCQEHPEGTVKSPIKKKNRKKSWFRHLCPGCKVYRDDK